MNGTPGGAVTLLRRLRSQAATPFYLSCSIHLAHIDRPHVLPDHCSALLRINSLARAVFSSYFNVFHADGARARALGASRVKQSTARVSCLCGGISWTNVGHSVCGGTPVQRAGCVTWMLPVKMATVWLHPPLLPPFSPPLPRGPCHTVCVRERVGVVVVGGGLLLKQTSMTSSLQHQCQKEHRKFTSSFQFRDEQTNPGSSVPCKEVKLATVLILGIGNPGESSLSLGDLRLRLRLQLQQSRLRGKKDVV